MKLKKLISAFMLMVMIFTLTACIDTTPSVQNTGNDNPGGDGSMDIDDIFGAGEDFPEVEIVEISIHDVPGVDFDKPPIQLEVFSQTANFSGKIMGWFAEVLLQEFNVEMTIVPMPQEGIFDARMERRNLGDILILADEEHYRRAATEGLLFNWNEDDILETYGSYIRAKMPHAIRQNERINQSFLGRDGIVHGIGHDIAISPEDHEFVLYSWDLRWDLYKELGYPDVKNLDDLFQLANDMRALEPTDLNGNPTYAFSLWPDWDGAMVMYIKAFATAYWGHDEMGFGHYDVVTGDFYHALDIGGPYWESLKFFNKLHRADLIDPNSATQTFDIMAQKMSAGGVFMSIFNYAGQEQFNTVENIAQDRFMYTLVPEEATPIAYQFNVFGGSRIWAIGETTEYPELCMFILNWLATPHGAMTYFHGPKDNYYSKDGVALGGNWYYDDEGWVRYTDLGEQCRANRRSTTMPDAWGGGTFNDGSFQANNTIWSRETVNLDSLHREVYNSDLWASRNEVGNSPMMQDWRNFTGAFNTADYINKHGFMSSVASVYKESSQDATLKLTWEQVARTIRDGTWRALYASSDEEFDRIFQEMIDTANGFDPDGITLEWCLNEAALRKSLEDIVVAQLADVGGGSSTPAVASDDDDDDE